MSIILDRFQTEAINLINEGKSVLVSAPTGAGKTLIAEFVMKKALNRGESVIYTSPVKALSNQKFRDLSIEFPEKTGIVTGDVSINGNAQLLIMTTEILRNRLVSDTMAFKNYSWVIFDEIHYIDDPERGTVWEESLMFLPDNMNFLGLSATLPNVDEFANWITGIRNRKVEVVTESKRPVPLKFYFVSGRKVYNNIESAVGNERSQGNYGGGFGTIKKKLPGDSAVINLILSLKKRDRLPAIYFTMNRKRTVSLATSLASINFLSSEESEKVNTLLKSKKLRKNIPDNLDYSDIVPLLKKGIAFHHAGMLPSMKEAVEKLFTSGLIKVVFATSTFALGINMPAKSVILDELKKRFKRSFRLITKRDFMQMGGRAGRRGIDDMGFVYSFINDSLRKHSLKHLIEGAPEPVSSRFDLSYAGILNLYENYGEDLSSIYFKSFKYFQEKKHDGGKSLLLLKKKIKILKDLKYLDKDGVTPIGRFAREIHGYELPFGELFKSNIIPGLHPADLVYIALALVYDPGRGEDVIPDHGRSKFLYKLTKSAISKIHRYEKKNSIRYKSPSFNFSLSHAAEAWMKKEPFYLSLYLSDIDEGDLVRYFRMSIQILRELLNTGLSNDTVKKIEKAIHLINRDIIDAERELRGENA